MMPDDSLPARIPGPFEELERQARALAQQRGIDPVRVLAIVRRGIELSSRHGEAMAHSVFTQLRAALDLWPPERALEILERENLVSLMPHGAFAAHLADPDTPFYTFAELAELLVHFRSFLHQHQAAILTDGAPPARFTESRWLDRHLSCLYYLRIPSAGDPEGAPGQDPREFDIWRLRESLGERAHERATGQLKLDRTDADRLAAGRPKLLELKLGVLSRIEAALRRGSAEHLWSDCLDLMNQVLTAEEVAFYLRADRIYCGEDARKDGFWDEPSLVRSATLPGGFSDLLEVLGRCECELRFRVMDPTKKELVALAREIGRSDWREVLGRTYFEVLEQPWRPQLDNILDHYVERGIAAAASGYWDAFRDRLFDALRSKWLWAPGNWSAMRKELERVVVNIVRNSGASPASLPDRADTGAGEQSYAREAPQPVIENVFMKEGKVWRVRFAGTEKPVLHRKGMHYILYLLEHPEQEIDVVDLVHELERPEARGLGGSSIAMSVAEATAAGVGSDALGRGGRMTDPKAMKGPRPDERMRGPRDKARDAVKGAVARAKQEIKTAHPALYDHLKASLKIGNSCSYRPTTPTLWNRPGVRPTSRVRPT